MSETPMCTKCGRKLVQVLGDVLPTRRKRYVHADDQSPICFGGKVGWQQHLPMLTEESA